MTLTNRLAAGPACTSRSHDSDNHRKTMRGDARQKGPLTRGLVGIATYSRARRNALGCFDTAEVTGSIPVAPTTETPPYGWGFFNVGGTLGTKPARMVIPVVSRGFPSFRALTLHNQTNPKQETHYLSRSQHGQPPGADAQIGFGAHDFADSRASHVDIEDALPSPPLDEDPVEPSSASAPRRS
jgi:hypothetical protein